MKASALYLLTAIATGIHVIYLAMWSSLGAPKNPLHYVVFTGCAILAIAALLAPFRPRAAAILALVGSLAALFFYLPALIYNSLTPYTYGAAIKDAIRSGEYLGAVGPIVAAILLVASTIYAIRRLMRAPVAK
jgi:hypothetical protein